MNCVHSSQLVSVLSQGLPITHQIDFFFFKHFWAFFPTVWSSQRNCREDSGWSWPGTVIQRVVFLLLGDPDWFHYDGFLSGLISKYLRVAARPHQDGSRFIGLQFIVCDGPRAAGRCSPAEALWKGVEKVDVILAAFLYSLHLSPETGNGEINSPPVSF